MSNSMGRIQYLTHKAQRGVLSSIERNELAHLLDKDPREFEKPDALEVLIGIALTAIAVAIIVAIINDLTND